MARSHIAVCLLLSACAHHTGGALPDAKAIIARSVKAIGGEAAIRAHTSLVSHGHLDMTKQGIHATFTQIQQAPDRLYTRMELTGVGVLEEGVDGGLAWSKDPIAGPRIKQGLESAQSIRQADFYYAADLAKLYTSLTTTGQSDLDGEQVYEVRMVPPEGDEETGLFDRSSCRMVGVRAKLQTMMGAMPTTTTSLDFRLLGDVWMPYRIHMQATVMSTDLVWDDLQWDVPNLVFPAVPDEVKAIQARP